MTETAPLPLVNARFVILGAGFGGLELAARLSAEFGPDADATLIDKNESFVFGFSKFELMLGRAALPEVSLYYRDLVKPGVTFRRETVARIEPAARRVTTDRAEYVAEHLVIALGAEYDPAATPGFVEDGHEFYSINGALELAGTLPAFSSGALVIGILGQPFKCPPAPCEAAMLLDQWFTDRGVRSAIQISVVSPWGIPVPPSPDGSKAILDRFAERGMSFVNDQTIIGLDPARKLVRCADGSSLPYDLFLGIPVHRVPAVVALSGLAENGWIPVDKTNLATRFPNVYAIGDVASAPVPKAGVFAESAARAVAEHLIAGVRGSGTPAPYDGTGTCYVEFGDRRVGRVDADFLTGPSPVAPFAPASFELAQEKAGFAPSRRQRWFGR